MVRLDFIFIQPLLTYEALFTSSFTDTSAHFRLGSSSFLLHEKWEKNWRELWTAFTSENLKNYFRRNTTFLAFNAPFHGIHRRNVQVLAQQADLINTHSVFNMEGSGVTDNNVMMKICVTTSAHVVRGCNVTTCFRNLIPCTFVIWKCARGTLVSRVELVKTVGKFSDLYFGLFLTNFWTLNLLQHVFWF